MRPERRAYILDVSTESGMSSEQAAEREERRKREFMRVFGSAPWLKRTEKKCYRVKLFKSGNSIAVRIPAELGFKAGTEMEMEVEDGLFLSLEPVERPRRKFDVAKVWGIAPELELIKPEDRAFDDPPRPWDTNTAEPGGEQ